MFSEHKSIGTNTFFIVWRAFSGDSKALFHRKYGSSVPICSSRSCFYLETRVDFQLFEEKTLFFRWHQAKAIQQTPRYSRTEGSPLKSHVPPTTRGTLRRPPALKQFGDGDKEKEQTETLRSATTPYRLPRLSETRAITERPKEYVYKQPLSAAHFLIRKDPK